jgi:uncharacterized protein (DUF433 family)
MTMDTFTTPLLTARETARHLRMPESTLDAWLVNRGGGNPLVHAVTPEKRGWPRVPFVGIVEAYVLRSLRELGLSMQDIRKAAEIVRSEFDDPYALANKRLATDGIRIFVRLADDSVIHVRDRQSAIKEVIARDLRYIVWDESGRPRQLRLPQYPADAGVVIDPRFGWGTPVLAQSKVPVASLVSLWRTGESMTDIGDEYGLSTSTVEDVLRQAA